MCNLWISTICLSADRVDPRFRTSKISNEVCSLLSLSADFSPRVQIPTRRNNFVELFAAHGVLTVSDLACHAMILSPDSSGHSGGSGRNQTRWRNHGSAERKTMSRLHTRRAFVVGATLGSVSLVRSLRAADLPLRSTTTSLRRARCTSASSKCGPPSERRPAGGSNHGSSPRTTRSRAATPRRSKMLVAGEIQFFTLMGGILGNVVPVAEVQQVPFAFRSAAHAHQTVDGPLGPISVRKWPPRAFRDSPSAPSTTGCGRLPGRNGRFASLRTSSGSGCVFRPARWSPTPSGRSGPSRSPSTVAASARRSGRAGGRPGKSARLIERVQACTRS